MKYVIGYHFGKSRGDSYAIREHGGFDWLNPDLNKATKFDSIIQLIEAVFDSEGVVRDFAQKRADSYFVATVEELPPPPTDSQWRLVEEL